MKSKLLIIGLGIFVVSAKGQIVDTSAAGVDIYFETSSDTLYSEFDTFAGLKVTGDDLGHVLINSSGNTLKTTASGVTRNTTMDSVILELTENMRINLEDGVDDSSGSTGEIPQIRGGLKLGYSTEILNTSATAYPHFLDGQQYRYVEQFDNGRSTIFAPTLKNAERDSLRFGDGTEANKLSAIHFWDNTTVSFVTGYETAATRATWTGSGGDVSSTGTDDYTTYSVGNKGYVHTEVDGGETYTSEAFLPEMVDNGRAVVVYYGDFSATGAGLGNTMDSIYSEDGFHDGEINLDITNTHPTKGIFRHWHMIGNPYKSAIKLSDYLAEPLTGTHVTEVNGYYAGRTISLLTDIDAGTAGFQPGYAAVNSSGIVVGVNNDHTTTGGTGITTITDLAPGQGFFVFHTADPGQTVTTKFTNAMRTSGEETLMKKAQFTEPMAFVNVQQVGNYSDVVAAQKWNQLAVTISDDLDPKQFNSAAMKQDLSVDGEEMMSTRDINIYSQDNHSDEYGYAMKTVETSMVNKLIPVGFESKEGNVKYEFSLSNISVNLEDYDVYVVDRLLNTTHNISKKGPYTCNIFKPGQQQDRFYLKFGHSEEEGFEEIVEIYSNGNFINIMSNSQNTEIEEFGLFDVLGKEVVNLKPKAFQSYQYDIRNLPRGVYFVRVMANGKEYNSKVLNNNN